MPPSYCSRTSGRGGFTLIELLVVISIIALLIGILLPSLGSARELARSLDCKSRMRQFAFAAEIYANDNKDRYPERSPENVPGNKNLTRWPGRFQPTYSTVQMLVCPSVKDPWGPGYNEDNPDQSHRTYMFNGFDDFEHTDSNWTEAATTTMSRAQIKQTSATLLFGEMKREGSASFWVDIFASTPDELRDVEEQRHGGSNSGNGYSNYAYADGHVGTLGFAGSYDPINMWAVTSVYRETWN